MATHTGSTGSDTIKVTMRNIMCIGFTMFQPRGYVISTTAGFVTPSGAFDDITLAVYAGNGGDRIDLSPLTLGAGLTSVLINGDHGDDTVIGSIFADILNGGDGNDNLSGGEGDDWIHGGPQDDSLSGGDGIDTILGGDGADAIKGDAGNDSLSGELGDDRLYAGLGDDLLYGGAGNDSLHGDNGNDRLYGDVGNDGLNGGYGNDWLYGDVGSDNLIGDDGGDRLFGDSGNDLLSGGKGFDELTGGQGRDAFCFSRPTDDRDVIIDFDPALVSGDYFSVWSQGFETIGGPGVLPSERFRMGAAAITPSHRFIYNPSTGSVFFDSDGVGPAAQVVIARIAASLSLSNAHFLVA